MRTTAHCLVIDLEATCEENMPPPQPWSEIIEIGLAVVDTASREIVSTRQLIIRPEHSPITEFCTRLTGITPEQADAGMTFLAASRLLRKEYGSRDCFWASYSSSDQRSLRRECAEKVVPFPFSHSYIDVKAAVEFHFGTTLGLSEALARTELGFEGRPHSGIDDAYNTARLLLHIL